MKVVVKNTKIKIVHLIHLYPLLNLEASDFLEILVLIEITIHILKRVTLNLTDCDNFHIM